MLCPSSLARYRISRNPIGTIIVSVTVSVVSVVRHDMSLPIKGCSAGLRGMLLQNCSLLVVPQLLAAAICQANLAGYSSSARSGIVNSPRFVFHGSRSCE